MLTVSCAAAESLVIDTFDNGLTGWDIQEFAGKTDYSIVHDDQGNAVLQAVSRGSASGLIKKIEFDARDYPLLRWRWKVTNVLASGDARNKKGDDYAARIYVIFLIGSSRSAARSTISGPINFRSVKRYPIVISRVP